jgi:hypothetical protein
MLNTKYLPMNSKEIIGLCKINIFLLNNAIISRKYFEND